MTTRMVHSEHGATHAYDSGEIERLEKLGWAVEKAEVPIVNLPKVVDETPVPFVPPVVVQRNKPGPKPKAK